MTSVPKSKPERKKPKPRGWQKGAKKRTARNDRRVKRWMVFGRFQKNREEQTIETWEGESQYWKVALRRAIKEIAQRESIKWMSQEEVHFTIQRVKE